MKRAIVDFDQDEVGDWVAELSCGHTQHIRHDPPWTERPWVISYEGRKTKLGVYLECNECVNQ